MKLQQRFEDKYGVKARKAGEKYLKAIEKIMTNVDFSDCIPIGTFVYDKKDGEPLGWIKRPFLDVNAISENHRMPMGFIFKYVVMHMDGSESKHVRFELLTKDQLILEYQSKLSKVYSQKQKNKTQGEI